ncbi:DUF6197 family protein [Streptodolium elevatio]|uniref:Uncharacterized protein n=1 Tax=Streptodolium elevatio TaxID=3157996 RepID=A0ABV3DKT2_9ACTN
MTTIPNPQIYRNAIDVIRERGWHQGDFFNDDGVAIGGCCIAGAIRYGTNGYPSVPSDATDEAEMWLVEKVLGAYYFDWVMLWASGGCADAVGKWNDAPDRTKAEVIAALEAAATAAESARAASQTGGEGRG